MPERKRDHRSTRVWQSWSHEQGWRALNQGPTGREAPATGPRAAWSWSCGSLDASPPGPWAREAKVLSPGCGPPPPQGGQRSKAPGVSAKATKGREGTRAREMGARKVRQSLGLQPSPGRLWTGELLCCRSPECVRRCAKLSWQDPVKGGLEAPGFCL